MTFPALVRALAVFAVVAPACAGADAPLSRADVAYAEEYVWARDYYVREDIDAAPLEELLERATAILQDRNRADDTACPVRLEARVVRRYRDPPRFAAERKKRGGLMFPGDKPGVYLAPGPGPSFAAGDRTYVWLGKDWQRLTTSGAWALVHEHGHNAGLVHLDVRKGAVCSLMSYGPMANKCGGGRILAPFQCERYKAHSVPSGKPTLCLVETQNGVEPAPPGTPCSDGRGTCSPKGVCRRE